MKNLIKNSLIAMIVMAGTLGVVSSQSAQAQTKSEASAFASAQAWARTKGMVLMQRPMPQSPEELRELRSSTGIIFSPTSKLGEQVNVFGKGMTFRGQRHEALDVMYWDAKNSRTAVRECNNEGVMLFVVTPLEAIARAGAQGQAGATGATGQRGPQGRPGQNGTSGPQGPQGYQGQEGPQGPQGPRGYTGKNGAIVVIHDYPDYQWGLVGVTGPQASSRVIQEQKKGLFDYLAPILGAYVGRTQIGSTIMSQVGGGAYQSQGQVSNNSQVNNQSQNTEVGVVANGGSASSASSSSASAAAAAAGGG